MEQINVTIDAEERKKSISMAAESLMYGESVNKIASLTELF